MEDKSKVRGINRLKYEISQEMGIFKKKNKKEKKN